MHRSPRSPNLPLCSRLPYEKATSVRGGVPLSRNHWIGSQKQLGLGWKAMPVRGEQDKEASLLAEAANSAITHYKTRYFFRSGMKVIRSYKVLN